MWRMSVLSLSQENHCHDWWTRLLNIVYPITMWTWFMQNYSFFFFSTRALVICLYSDMPGTVPAAQKNASPLLSLLCPLHVPYRSLSLTEAHHNFYNRQTRHPLQAWSGRSSFLFIQQFRFLQYVETGSLFTIHYVLHGNFSYSIKNKTKQKKTCSS